MTKQAIGLLLLCVVLASAGGCGVCQAILYEPFGPGTTCDSRRCGLNACGDACGPVWEEPCGPGPWRREFGVRGALAEPCDEGCCPECGEVCCRRRCGIVRGPLSFVFALFTAGTYQGCGFGNRGGCGERYWGDWYSNPPECRDPCDCYGNFTGGCSGCGGYEGTMPAGMAGPYEEGGMAPQAGGCRSCGQGAVSSQTYGSPRYSPQYASRTQRYPSQYASGVHGRPSQYATRAPGYSSQYASGASGYPAQYAGQNPAQYSARAQRYPSQSPSKPNASGTYAPRLISTTDRVVKPATSERTPHLAQPLQTETRQE